MMFGEKSVELIKSATRQQNEPIPPHNQALVESVAHEMARLNADIQTFVLTKDSQPTASQDKAYSSLLLATQLKYSSLLWNKRCLIAYHYDRLIKLKKLRWEFGSVLPNDIRANLSEAELKWFTEYCQNLSEYMNKLNDGRGLDLTLYKKPPKRLYIQVRCIIDYGDFELDDGTIVIFSKDSVHYLPLSQCERLIHQGILEQITN